MSLAHEEVLEARVGVPVDGAEVVAAGVGAGIGELDRAPAQAGAVRAARAAAAHREAAADDLEALEAREERGRERTRAWREDRPPGSRRTGCAPHRVRHRPETSVLARNQNTLCL